ncbi:Na+/H+ antiporter NhaP [Fulvivirga imtechensis AK7]|uniref:Na+/H+ antiporter NhaP n=1 Tax=Fulvivirga imtechensis AK7 TaxID=1237149 RepID=L8JXA8_9BACT|nr:cation:proton antiporter [Fulvivirga imtechensis]ELR72818.1 Na+/H+ antiporter NhaP [Fulvivirga imtechensis AK7]
MEIFNSYTAVITISVIVIMSYFFNIISEKTNIPSVLLLILSGVLIKLGLTYFGIATGDSLFNILEILGIIGLIMIVLEASLDLELTREKWPLIWQSFTVALLSLLVCSFAIGWLINYLLIDSFFISLIYALPLSVMSSAIVIPSVGELLNEKKEFMVYESTFSDILGIMYFYFLIGNADSDSVRTVVWDVFSNIFITIVLSVAISYALVFIFQKVRTQVKLFLLIAVLLLLYSIGKLFHLSSLLIILIFGLVLHNHKIFFQGKLKKLIHIPSVKGILNNFHLITIESAFVVRTFFFVIFGITISLGTLLNWEVLFISLTIVVILFAIRAIFLRLLRGKSIAPEVLIAPRGLITILLFFAIPDELQVNTFSAGILLYTILISSVIMAMALIASGKHIEPVDAIQMAYWKEVDKEIESIPESEKNKSVEEKVKEKQDQETSEQQVG